jgi:uncharacterized membrane protein YgdD (TMEM256/DUF423 family)
LRFNQQVVTKRPQAVTPAAFFIFTSQRILIVAKLFLLLGAINAGLCVVLGAFAAHKLKTLASEGLISETSIATFQTGVQYHFYHSLALILLALFMLQLETVPASLRYAGFAFLAGIVLFSGSLYGLSLGSWKILGPVTPLGGLFFIVAWILMSVGVYKAL